MSNIRLDKLLSNLGYCSRKDAAALVKKGRVCLDKVAIAKSDQAVSLDTARQGRITLDGDALDAPSPFTVMLHKPAGLICSHDERGKLIYDLLPDRWGKRNPQLSCAGRLDKESTGQVILTDDGDLLHRIIHPKNHAVKQYKVTLAHPLRGDEATLFATGGFLMKEDVKPLKPAQWVAESHLSGVMHLQEGRYHQIRRMFETLGNHVTGLHRYATGGLALGGLAEGTFRVLSPEETESIFTSL